MKSLEKIKEIACRFDMQEFSKELRCNNSRKKEILRYIALEFFKSNDTIFKRPSSKMKKREKFLEFLTLTPFNGAVS
jgi:hypothetical protein